MFWCRQWPLNRSSLHRDVCIQISLLPWWPTIVQRKHKDFQTSPSQRYKYTENTWAAHINRGHYSKFTGEYEKDNYLAFMNYTTQLTPPRAAVCLLRLKIKAVCNWDLVHLCCSWFLSISMTGGERTSERGSVQESNPHKTENAPPSQVGGIRTLKQRQKRGTDTSVVTSKHVTSFNRQHRPGKEGSLWINATWMKRKLHGHVWQMDFINSCMFHSFRFNVPNNHWCDSLSILRFWLLCTYNSESTAWWPVIKRSAFAEL